VFFLPEKMMPLGLRRLRKLIGGARDDDFAGKIGGPLAQCRQFAGSAAGVLAGISSV
jgi:hypothetical protein